MHHSGKADSDFYPSPYEGTRNNIVIATDSQYTVDYLTDWVYRWENNGWANSKGKKVINADLILQAHESIGTLNSEFGMTVQFWKIPRNENKEADELATLSLSILEDDTRNAMPHHWTVPGIIDEIRVSFSSLVIDEATDDLLYAVRCKKLDIKDEESVRKYINMSVNRHLPLRNYW